MSISPCPNCQAYRYIKPDYKIFRRDHYILRCNKCGLAARGKDLDEAMGRWNLIVRRKLNES